LLDADEVVSVSLLRAGPDADVFKVVFALDAVVVVVSTGTDDASSV
jgi:hypothetical protein